jgi:nitronate monooxygenase
MRALSHHARDDIRISLQETRRLTQRPFGANLVLEWDQAERLEVLLLDGVRIISFSWGLAPKLIETAKAAGAIVIQSVSTAKAARHAVDAGADILVAQGWEAGGHVEGDIATLPLVRACVQAVPDVPVLAAGGIADGAGLVAALALGASGVWLGTRFLGAAEADIHPAYQNALFAADETSTVHTLLFDGDWPNAPHRVLCGATFESWRIAGSPPPGARPHEGEVIALRADGSSIRRYDSYSARRTTTGRIELMPFWAGQGVHALRRVQPAAEIVDELLEEAATAQRSLLKRQFLSLTAGKAAVRNHRSRPDTRRI